MRVQLDRAPLHDVPLVCLLKHHQGKSVNKFINQPQS